MQHARFNTAETEPEPPRQEASWPGMSGTAFEDDDAEDCVTRRMRRRQIIAGMEELCYQVAQSMARELLARNEAREQARARAREQQAVEAAPAPDAPAADDGPAEEPDHLALAFSRVTRALNLTLAQAERMERDRLNHARLEKAEALAETAARPSPEEAARAARRAKDDELYGRGTPTFEQRQRLYRKVRGEVMQHEIRYLVTQAIHAQIQDDEAIEEKVSELEAVIGHRDESDRFAWRPVGILAAAVCRHLGLTPDWSLWTRAGEREDDADDEDEDDREESRPGDQPPAANDPAAFASFGPIRPERARAPP